MQFLEISWDFEILEFSEILGFFQRFFGIFDEVYEDFQSNLPLDFTLTGLAMRVLLSRGHETQHLTRATLTLNSQQMCCYEKFIGRQQERNVSPDLISAPPFQ
jgi:hypothetical protein